MIQTSQTAESRACTTTDAFVMTSLEPPIHEPVSRRQKMALATIVAVGFAVRLAYLIHATGTPGFVWEDPDGYMQQALRLAGNGTSWQWTFDAVTYTINSQQHALPPMYSVFLSVFALFPGFPLSAQVAQVVLGSIAIVFVFELGRLVHSPATGLLSAAAYALWIPGIFNVWATHQETLYLPLILLAFVILSRAMISPSLVTFGFSGLVFGVAAMTRSMPMFFIFPAAALVILLAPDRRRARRDALTFVAGFVLITVPYIIVLSQHFGQLTLIDTHGSIHFGGSGAGRAPGVIETAGAMAGEMLAEPVVYFSRVLTHVQSLLHVNGGRLMQIYVVAPSAIQAVVWKLLVHLGSDGILLASCLLAGIGAALCRRPRIALVWLTWTAINIGIASFGGFGGARLRVPFEPLLMILAAAGVAGGWRRRGTPTLLAGVALGVLSAIAIVPQIPRSLRSWPDYGVEWPSIFSRQAGAVDRNAGFNVPVMAQGNDGVAAFTLESSGSSPVGVRIRVDGVAVRTVEIDPGESEMVRVLSRYPGMAFVELETTESGLPRLRLMVSGR